MQAVQAQASGHHHSSLAVQEAQAVQMQQLLARVKALEDQAARQAQVRQALLLPCPCQQRCMHALACVPDVFSERRDQYLLETCTQPEAKHAGRKEPVMLMHGMDIPVALLHTPFWATT